MKSGMRKTQLSKQTLERRILRYYSGDHLLWYENVNRLIKEWSVLYNVPDHQVAGVIAALSPLKSWEQNKQLTIGFFNGVRSGHLKNCIDKAVKIIENKDPVSVLGRKQYAFMQNLLLNDQYVTVDRHIIRIIFNKLVRPTTYRYNLAETAYKSLAKKLSIAPYQLQADTWVGIRGKAY